MPRQRDVGVGASALVREVAIDGRARAVPVAPVDAVRDVAVARQDAGLPPPPRRRADLAKSEVTNTLWNVLPTGRRRRQYAALDSLVGETNEVGAEFRAANDAAISVGAEVVRDDRAVALTQLRLKRLVPAAEWVYVLFYGDGELWRRRCFERMEAAKALNRTVDDLLSRVGEAEAEAVRAAEAARLGESLRRQADEALNAAAPDFCDAALMDVLVRFWWYDPIGAPAEAAARGAQPDGRRRPGDLAAADGAAPSKATSFLPTRSRRPRGPPSSASSAARTSTASNGCGTPTPPFSSRPRSPSRAARSSGTRSAPARSRPLAAWRGAPPASASARSARRCRRRRVARLRAAEPRAPL